MDKGLSGNIVGHGGLWWVEDLVVRTARGGVDETAGDSRNKELVVNAELNGVLERQASLVEHVVEALGLGDSARETIEDESVKVVGLVPPQRHCLCTRRDPPALALGVVLELVLNHVDHNLVADKTTLVHDLLGLSSQLGLLCDLGAKHVTGSLRKRLSTGVFT